MKNFIINLEINNLKLEILSYQKLVNFIIQLDYEKLKIIIDIIIKNWTDMSEYVRIFIRICPNIQYIG